MKSNLILKKFDTNNVIGTMNINNLKTFFGGKVPFLEESIDINNDSIEFSQVDSGKQKGYQYYDYDNIDEELETIYIENLVDLKDNNHTVTLLTPKIKTTNTVWEFKINARKILKDYLFFKFKENRIFNSINYNELYNGSINDSIYNYINNDILNNYKFDSFDLYLVYNNISTKQSTRNRIYLSFEPYYNPDIYDTNNKVSNYNIIKLNEYYFDEIIFRYYQTKNPYEYIFDYYFNIRFIKI